MRIRYQMASACFILSAFSVDPSSDPLAQESAKPNAADLVLLGGNVVTVEKRQATAEAVAVRGDRIVAVGTDDEISGMIRPKTRIVQLKGRLMVPGFIEGHGHFVGLGESKMMLDLTKAQTWDDVVRMVAGATEQAAEGDWIVGRGWHQAKWKHPPKPNVEGYPTHQQLSRISAKNPVLLNHASGHMCIANAAAMKLAGITKDSKAPGGGEILRDNSGNPTGVFRETAQGPLDHAYAASLRNKTSDQLDADLRRAIELATKECLKHGVTSFHDAGASFFTIDVFKRLAENRGLKVRLYVMVASDNGQLSRRLAAYRMIGFGNNYLTVRAIKRSIDGALGAHGAWLLAPYDDLLSSVGLNTSSIDSIRETARLAVANDFQLCVHAIGDRANRETLNIFAEALQSGSKPSDKRWRIEHAQHLHPSDIPRFARLGVIASMQAVHCTSDAVFVVQRIGQRRAGEGAYVWRKLIDDGAVICNGTDTPVEEINPIKCFYSSVTRTLPTGVAFFPEQCMTREQALRSYTLDAAYAAFEEDIKGSIKPGKLADLVVLSDNIMKCPAEDIPQAEVDLTIVGGKIVYQRGD